MRKLEQLRTETRFKLIASVLLALPAAVLLIFGIGEMLGGDISGAQHIPEAAALLILLAVGWRYPRAAGALLLGVGAALLMGWLVFVLREREPDPWVAAGLLLFLPPMVAGWLFLRAAR